MDFPTKGKLIDALQKTRAIGERANRDVMISQLPAQIKGVIAYNASDRLHILNIIDACLGYAGGLEQLFAIIVAIEGESEGVKEARALLDQGVISREDFRNALDLLAQIDVEEEDLKGMYRRSLPDGKQPSSEAVLLWNILHDLAQFAPQSDGRLPIVEFVERMVLRTQKAALFQKIRQWSDARIADFDLDPIKFNDLRTRLKNETKQAQEPCYLLVQLHPNPANRNHPKLKSYRVAVAFWKSAAEKTNLLTGTEYIPLDDVPRLVDEQIGILSEREDPALLTNLHIEFFLPVEILSAAVDQWDMSDEFLQQVKLGYFYPVHVRSLERAQTPKLQGFWRARWKYYKSLLQAGMLPNGAVELWEETCQPKELLNRLTGGEIKLPIGCGFTFLPAVEGANSPLLVAIRGGIPIAVWPRQCGDCADALQEVKEHLKALMAAAELQKLPTLIREMRRKADSAAHLGSNLTLLWDDPERIPDDLLPPRLFNSP